MAFAADLGQQLFPQGMFSVDPNSTPDQVATRRALLAALRPRYGSAKYIGEGLGQLATGLVEGRQNRQLNDIEGQGRQQADALFAGLLGGATGGERAASGQLPMSILGPNPQYGSEAEQIGADTMAAIGRPSNAPVIDGGALGVDFGGDAAGAFRSALIAGGLPEHAVDGIMLNAQDESAFNPTAVGDNGAAFGLLQWNGPRKRALEQFAAQTGGNPADPVVQANFTLYELQGPERRAYDALMASETAGQAGAAFVNLYERPAETHRARREAEYLGGASLPSYGGQGGGIARNPVTPQIPADQLVAAMTNPWLSAEQRGMLQTIYDQQVSQNDPMAAIELERAQLELAQMRNPQAKPQEPIEVGGVLLDPVTREVIFDSRAPEGGDPRYQPVGGQIWDMQPEGGGPPTLVGGGSEEVIYGPDGTPIVTRGPAGSARPFTEAQSKDVVFSTRAQGALDVLDPVSGKLTERLDIAAGYVPFGLGRGLQDPDYQVARQAADEFLQAILRKDTGAAITEQEQALYGVTYLPQPGDGPEVLQAKADARRRAISAIEAGMSKEQMIAQERALGGQAATPAAPAPPGQTLTYNPATGDFE